MPAEDASSHDPVSIQRVYYRQTADNYDEMHVAVDDEHAFALSFLGSLVKFFNIRSILDIGSGTGRAILALRSINPDIRIVGIEPSPELREVGYHKGLSKSELIDGDVLQLNFDANSFDLVCSFGVLHHIPTPRQAELEMLRVAKRAIFISDHNDYGRGTKVTRFVKRSLNALGLWSAADRILTKGRGYRVTEDDGVWYSYSILDTYAAIAPICSRVHLLNTMKLNTTKSSGSNLYRSASHVALLGIK